MKWWPWLGWNTLKPAVTHTTPLPTPHIAKVAAKAAPQKGPPQQGRASNGDTKAAESAKATFDKNSPFYFDGTISRRTLENYLDHAITMGYFLVPGQPEGYRFPYRDDDVRMIHNLGAKLIGRAIYRWGEESKLAIPPFWSMPGEWWIRCIPPIPKSFSKGAFLNR